MAPDQAARPGSVQRSLGLGQSRAGLEVEGGIPLGMRSISHASAALRLHLRVPSHPSLVPLQGAQRTCLCGPSPALPGATQSWPSPAVTSADLRPHASPSPRVPSGRYRAWRGCPEPRRDRGHIGGGCCSWPAPPPPPPAQRSRARAPPSRPAPPPAFLLPLPLRLLRSGPARRRWWQQQ